jgi:hypothetical protein
MMSKPPLLFFGFGERAIGYQQLAVADADGGGIAARPEPRRIPRVSTSASQAWICGRPCTSAELKITDSSSPDHQHVLHGPPSVVTIVPRPLAQRFTGLPSHQALAGAS